MAPLNAAPVANLAPALRGDDAGKLVLRVAVGLLLLLHGIDKLGASPDGIAGMLQRAGLPGALAYLVYVGELLAPLLLIAGAWTRVAAGVIVINMLFAIGLAHMGQLLSLNGQGGWSLELQGLYLFGALAIVLLGAGRFSLTGVSGRYN